LLKFIDPPNVAWSTCHNVVSFYRVCSHESQLRKSSKTFCNVTGSFIWLSVPKCIVKLTNRDDTFIFEIFEIFFLLKTDRYFRRYSLVPFNEENYCSRNAAETVSIHLRSFLSTANRTNEFVTSFRVVLTSFLLILLDPRYHENRCITKMKLSDQRRIDDSSAFSSCHTFFRLRSIPLLIETDRSDRFYFFVSSSLSLSLSLFSLLSSSFSL